jgi:hypothetical protein
MSLLEGWARVFPNGEFVRDGIDHFHAVVVKRKQDILVVKQDGGTYWAGIGMDRARAGAEYQVWSILEDKPGDPGGEVDRIKVKLLVDFPVRKVTAT